MDQTLATLKTCGVLAIVRAKNADVAIERGIELCAMGCRAIEVTLDTVLAVLFFISFFIFIHLHFCLR